MAEYGAEVTCFNRRGCDNGGLSEYKGVKLINVLTIRKKGLAAASSSFFASIKAAFGRFDVIHFHAEGPCAMMWIPKLFGKKCVCTIHGHPTKEQVKLILEVFIGNLPEYLKNSLARAVTVA